jgi:hypothetical protein
MNQEKYIGYLESQIANTMWPSGLCRGEEAIPASLPQTGECQTSLSLLLDIVLRCYRPFRKARSLSGGL